jgi:hypothetical protein
MFEYRRKLLKEIGITKSEFALLYADWFKISRSGNLSEKFIREFKDNIHWGNLCINQKLSDDFLIEFQEMINWTEYFMFNDSSFTIMKKFITKAIIDCDYHFRLSHFNENQRNEIQRIIKLKNIFQNKSDTKSTL